jgi:hypothetical protein
MENEEAQQSIDGDTTEEVTSFSSLNVSIRKSGQRFTSLEEMQQAQQLFLACLAETGVLINSCRLSHVSFPTYQGWLNDADFAEACKAALENHKEKVFLEVDRRGRKGFTEVLVRNGKLVTDKKGKPVLVRKYSDRLLELLFNKYYSVSAMQSRYGFTAEQDGSDMYIHLPWDELTEEEQAIIETIGRNIEARQSRGAMN